MAELFVTMERRDTVLALSYRPTRPTDPTDRSTRARHGTDPFRSGAGSCRQGAEVADLACLEHSCAVRRRASFHIVRPWLSRPARRERSARGDALGRVSVRPSRRREPMVRTSLLPAC